MRRTSSAGGSGQRWQKDGCSEYSTMAGTEVQTAHGAPAASSLASSAAASGVERLAMINGQHHLTMDYLKDLLWFDVTVKGPLETAAGLLRGSGGGLADDIQAAVSQAHALTEHATGVLLGYAATAQQLSSRVMPGLRVAMSDLKTTRTSVANLLGMVQGLTADPRAAARESRRRYVRLLEQVSSIFQQVSFARDADAGAEAAAWQQGGAPDAAALDAALRHLGMAVELLEDCSDVWLILHGTERTLGKLEGAVKEIRGRVLSGPKLMDLSADLGPVYASLEMLCQQYCAGHPPTVEAL